MLPKGDAAGRRQDPSRCAYLRMQAPAEQLSDWDSSPYTRPCLSVALIGIARFHVTMTSSGRDWCCALLQLVSRLQRSYRRAVQRQFGD